ncbi:MAG: hypothetical protein HOH95_06315 [Dehalococcoidia bacterium]|nr:hypothetical protein [Dehalococcoidia bacterium]
MNLKTTFATVAAAVLSLALVAPATAAVNLNADVAQPAIAPSGPGDNGKPDTTGRPEEPGQPNEPGVSPQSRPGDVGPSSRDLPELPENASPKAHAAVEAAYEQFAAISARLAAIRDLEPGADRNAALNEVFAEFGSMINTVADAVHEVDDDGDDAEPEDAELALNEEDADAEGDTDSDEDADADTDSDKDPDEDDDDDDNQDDKDSDSGDSDEDDSDDEE